MGFLLGAFIAFALAIGIIGYQVASLQTQVQQLQSQIQQCQLVRC